MAKSGWMGPPKIPSLPDHGLLLVKLTGPGYKAVVRTTCQELGVVKNDRLVLLGLAQSGRLHVVVKGLLWHAAIVLKRIHLAAQQACLSQLWPSQERFLRIVQYGVNITDLTGWGFYFDTTRH